MKIRPIKSLLENLRDEMFACFIYRNHSRQYQVKRACCLNLVRGVHTSEDALVCMEPVVIQRHQSDQRLVLCGDGESAWAGHGVLLSFFRGICLEGRLT